MKARRGRSTNDPSNIHETGVNSSCWRGWRGCLPGSTHAFFASTGNGAHRLPTLAAAFKREIGK